MTRGAAYDVKLEQGKGRGGERSLKVFVPERSLHSGKGRARKQLFFRQQALSSHLLLPPLGRERKRERAG